MTDAEKAYSVAEEMIAEALVSGQKKLVIDDENTFALEVLPPQISELTELHHLDCSNMRISDLTPLSGLASLKVLSLQQTEVSDVTPLSGLKSLVELSLIDTQVSDLNSLSSLFDMEILHLDNTLVANLSTLSGLNKLSELRLNDTPVSDLSPLSQLDKLERLHLSYTLVYDLLPLSNLSSLIELSLSGTRVEDLSPLSSLNKLRGLYLVNTPVSDLTPVSRTTSLTRLYIDRSAIGDLRPIQNLLRLHTSPDFDGLSFLDSKAAFIDPKIDELAQIAQPAERAIRLFSYLEKLGPNWESNLSAPDPMFNVVPEGERLEVAASVPSEAERDERLKQVLHAQLQDRSKALAQQAGNQFFRLAARARGLVDQVDKDFAELDVLMLHLAIEDLRAMEALGREDVESGEFPPEVLVALSDVLRLGPGLTLGHADVDLLVERANARRAADPVPEAETQAQDAMSDALASDEAAIGDRLRALETAVAHSDIAENREAQKGANRSVLWRIAVWGGGVVLGTTEAAGVTLMSTELIAFIKMHWFTLESAAITYGSWFAEWFGTTVTQAKEFADLTSRFAKRRKSKNAED